MCSTGKPLIEARINQQHARASPAPHHFRTFHTNQFPNIAMPDPSFREYSRYPAQAVPKPAVRYGSPSKAMTIAVARNAVGPPQVNNRMIGEILGEPRNSSRVSEATNVDSKELYYQVSGTARSYA